VRASTTAPGRYDAALLLTFRLADLPDRPAWLREGGRVAALVGSGEHAGQLRLVAGEAFPFGRIAGRYAGRGFLSLRLPLPPGMAPGRRPTMNCEHDYGADWLELTLPNWPAVPGDAAPRAAGTASAVAAPAGDAAPRAAGTASAVAAQPAKRLLTPDVLSHPTFASPRGQAAHAAAMKGTVP
jgi:hypothetical protein